MGTYKINLGRGKAKRIVKGGTSILKKKIDVSFVQGNPASDTINVAGNSFLRVYIRIKMVIVEAIPDSFIK
jgi:hypothetical protein